MRLLLYWLLLTSPVWADSTYIKVSDTVMVEQTSVIEAQHYTIRGLKARRADYVEAIAKIDALLIEAEKLGIIEKANGG